MLEEASIAFYVGCKAASFHGETNFLFSREPIKHG